MGEGEEGGGEGGFDWGSAGLSEEQTALVSDRKWESPAALIDSYRNLETKMGAPPERIWKLPAADDAEGQREFATRLGVPESAEAYKFDGVEAPEGIIDLRESLRSVLHERNITEEAATSILKAVHSAQSEAAQATAKAQMQRMQTAMDELKAGDWQADYDARMANMRSGYQLMGLTDDQADRLAETLGEKAYFEAIEKLGRRMGETDQGRTGDKGGSPEAHNEQIQREMSKILEDDPALEKPSNKQRYHELCESWQGETITV